MRHVRHTSKMRALPRRAVDFEDVAKIVGEAIGLASALVNLGLSWQLFLTGKDGTNGETAA